MPQLERHYLFGLCIIVLLAAWMRARVRLLKSLPRMRWLLLAIFAVYAWSTPGVYLFPVWFSPTLSGIFEGVEQSVRLLVVAASLQIMLTNLSKSDIVSGLYYLILPLSHFGLDALHFSVRLALTLESAEQLLERKFSFTELMRQIMNPESQRLIKTSIVDLCRLSVWQGCCLVVQLVLIIGTVLIGNIQL
ncbi:hypothetical protein HZU75_16025 [Chitinibacter fontanus]|uniref:Energy-coupling factor transporter transmembrane protein EcfT n=1 Tax=Chitinibacter fontanus TaxID=1737446 RepID=A0A7D5ZJI8_9NEIS|nr:hypothetical protein [Chitinibacter fontanus]QLI82907.1 hypothetical protein HZU75_16025 [Chitinibacter fontanus]